MYKCYSHQWESLIRPCPCCKDRSERVAPIIRIEIPIVDPGKSDLEKLSEILEYCSGRAEQMWAATIAGIILECDFRDVKQRIKEYKDG